MLIQITEHVPLYSTPSYKEMTRDSGGANNMHLLSWQTTAREKDRTLWVEKTTILNSTSCKSSPLSFRTISMQYNRKEAIMSIDHEMGLYYMQKEYSPQLLQCPLSKMQGICPHQMCRRLENSQKRGVDPFVLF